MMQKLNEARKAVVAFVVPGLGSIIAAMQADTPGGDSVVTSEWLTALLLSLTAGGFVYGIRNAKSLDPTTSTPEV